MRHAEAELHTCNLNSGYTPVRAAKGCNSEAPQEPSEATANCKLAWYSLKCVP